MVGLGIDIVQVGRIDRLLTRYGDRFRRRCFLSGELDLARRRGSQEAVTLAARWAAKEAVVKALGTAGSGVAYHDIEVVTDTAGVPGICLHGSAAAALRAAGASDIRLSLSHEKEYAVAVVCLT